MILHVLTAGDHGGGRRRGCRRPVIGHQVGDGDVALMAHGGDHRNRAGGKGARHDLLVEGPQILQTAATPADNQGIQATCLACS